MYRLDRHQRGELRRQIEAGYINGPYLEWALNTIDDMEKRLDAVRPILDNYVRLECYCKSEQPCYACVARSETQKSRS